MNNLNIFNLLLVLAAMPGAPLAAMQPVETKRQAQQVETKKASAGETYSKALDAYLPDALNSIVVEYCLGRTKNGCASAQNADKTDFLPAISYKTDWKEESDAAACIARSAPQVFICSKDNLLRVYDLKGEKGSVISLKERVSMMRATPDGKFCVVLPLRFKLIGHTIHVQQAASVIRVWDTDLKEARTFSGHTRPIHTLVLSKDGAFVLTASEDATARIWDIKTAKALVLEGHKGFVADVNITHDNKLAATASHDGTAKIWDARTGKLLHTLLGHKNQVCTVDFRADGKVVLTTSKDKTARLWNTQTGACIATFAHEHSFAMGVISGDGSRIFTISECMRPYCEWSVKTGKKVQEFGPEDRGILCMHEIFEDSARFALAELTTAHRVNDRIAERELKKLSQEEFDLVKQLVADIKSGKVAAIETRSETWQKIFAGLPDSIRNCLQYNIAHP